MRKLWRQRTSSSAAIPSIDQLLADFDTYAHQQQPSSHLPPSHSSPPRRLEAAVTLCGILSVVGLLFVVILREPITVRHAAASMQAGNASAAPMSPNQAAAESHEPITVRRAAASVQAGSPSAATVSPDYAAAESLDKLGQRVLSLLNSGAWTRDSVARRELLARLNEMEQLATQMNRSDEVQLIREVRRKVEEILTRR